MGRKFHHLTYSDRLKIEALHMAKHTSQEIADQLGVHVSTINRELKRGVYIHLNTDWTEEERYSPEQAEEKYRNYLKKKGQEKKSGEMKSYYIPLKTRLFMKDVLLMQLWKR